MTTKPVALPRVNVMSKKSAAAEPVIGNFPEPNPSPVPATVLFAALTVVPTGLERTMPLPPPAAVAVKVALPTSGVELPLVPENVVLLNDQYVIKAASADDPPKRQAPMTESKITNLLIKCMPQCLSRFSAIFLVTLLSERNCRVTKQLMCLGSSAV